MWHGAARVVGRGNVGQLPLPVAGKVIAASSETCARLASLRTTIVRDVGKGNLTQANTLVAVVDGVNAKLSC